MSLPIWTPAALWSERRAQESDCWRLVEAQHQISTLKLTDGYTNAIVFRLQFDPGQL